MARRQHRQFQLRRLSPAFAIGLCALAGTAQAQFFGDRYYNEGGGYNGYNGYGGYQRHYSAPREEFNFPFGDRFMRPAPPPADYSKAPPPRKLDTPPATNIVVIGDSLADWLAYGLDETYTDQPEMGVERKIRPTSGLIRYDAKNETLDWPQAIKDALAGEKPNAIVVMLGINDRIPLKDRVPPKPVPPAKPEAQGQAQGAPGQPQAAGQTQEKGQEKAQEKAQEKGQEKAQEKTQEKNQEKSQEKAQGQAPTQPAAPSQSTAAADSEGGAQPASAQPVATGGTFDFHTDKWAELYGRRVDEMINALKSKGVPILWVGMPALRGTKSTSDMEYLDEIYRERAEKAGIAYVDIWDGFVDDQGRYTVQGPDFEGQTRKLRTPDGVHFTKAGAVKLASYVDQELRRVMSKGVTPVALPGPDSTAPKPATGAGTRPEIGPVVPLASGGGDTGGADLLGGGRPAQVTSTDPIAAKVLTRGDAITAPADRADNFAWPHRDAKASTATPDTGPLPGPEPVVAPPAPKKGADSKASSAKADAKSGDGKNKSASDQTGVKTRRGSSATLDGAAPPRPPKEIGGGF
jgi:uncharacterized protein